MKKPMILVREEFIENLVNFINEASTSLPYFVIESILQDCLNQIKILNKQQLETEREFYERYVAEPSSNSTLDAHKADNQEDNVEH